MENAEFEQLYRKYQSSMTAAALQILHNTSDAEDAVQQAFLSVAANPDRIEGPESSKTRAYLMLAVRCRAIDILRRRHPEEELPDPENLPDPAPDLTDALLVTQIFAKLPERYRRILQMRYYVGLSVKEIAKLEGIDRSSAGKLIKRAREKFRELLEE